MEAFLAGKKVPRFRQIAVPDACPDCLGSLSESFGLLPFRVLRESVTFIFNRMWAAIKRESLSVVAEGVSTPDDVDKIYQLFTGSDAGPFRKMDMVGLDVVLNIETHHAGIRPGVPETPRTLLKSYLEKGWAGRKAGRGFYNDYEK